MSGQDAHRQMTVTEAFFDILYVLVLQSLFPYPAASIEYVIVFAASFNSWLGEAFYNTRFDTDDIISRFATVLAMVAVVGQGNGLAAISKHSDLFRFGTFQFSYAFLRLLLVLKYVRAWWFISSKRSLLGWFAALFFIGAVLWVLSGVSCDVATSLALAIAGVVVEYATPFLLLSKMVTVHPAHISERFAAFTALVSAGNLFAISGVANPPAVGHDSSWVTQFMQPATHPTSCSKRRRSSRRDSS